MYIQKQRDHRAEVDRIRRLLLRMREAQRSGDVSRVLREAVPWLGMAAVTCTCYATTERGTRACVSYCPIAVTEPHGLGLNPVETVMGADCASATGADAAGLQFPARASTRSISACLTAYAQALVKAGGTAEGWSQSDASAIAYDILTKEEWALYNEGKCYGGCGDVSAPGGCPPITSRGCATAAEAWRRVSDAIGEAQQDLQEMFNNVVEQLQASLGIRYAERWQSAVFRLTTILQEYQKMLGNQAHPPACHTVNDIIKFCEEAKQSPQYQSLPQEFNWVKEYIDQVEAAALQYQQNGECQFGEGDHPLNWPCCDPDAIAAPVTPLVSAFG